MEFQSMEALKRLSRIRTIDFVRGLVIVIMAIDHTRDFFHATSFSEDPLDLKTTTPLLFMTRWITHLCAPIFVFLAGTSAFLMNAQQNNPAQTRGFLLRRGLVLILLELTLINLGIWSDVQFRTFLLQVIFAIGSGFVLLALVLNLPAWFRLVVAFLLIGTHDLLVGVKIENNDALEFVRSLFFDRGFFKIAENRAIVVGYPVLPWFGIMLLGFCCGPLFLMEVRQRKRSLSLSALVALLLFLILRYSNVYGDPKPWAVQGNFLNTLFSFIDVRKYPPSLLYTCVTLGLMFLLLRCAEGRENKFTEFFRTFGKVPMFFYLIHWYLLHGAMYVMVFLQGYGVEDLSLGLMEFGRPEGAGGGLGLVYLVWLVLIAVMYPLCRWYGTYKASHLEKTWLRYL